MKKEKRRKLSDAAIAFIIEERNSPYTVHTFEEISKLVEKKFGISIGRGAVSKSYHKYKNDVRFKNILKEDSQRKVKIQPKIKDQPKSDSYIDKKNKSDFDEDLGKNYNIDDFFEKH